MTVVLQRLFDATVLSVPLGYRHHELVGQRKLRQRVTHFTEELSFLSESDKDWVMGRAILRA